MRAPVGLRAVAVAADDIPPLPPRSGLERHDRADRIARTPVAVVQRDGEPMPGGGDVPEQRGPWS